MKLRVVGQNQDQVVEVKVKFRNKLQTELSGRIEAVTGIGFDNFKFFLKGKQVDTKKYLSDLEGVEENMEILAVEGKRKSYVYRRFVKIHEEDEWEYYPEEEDAFSIFFYDNLHSKPSSNPSRRFIFCIVRPSV